MKLIADSGSSKTAWCLRGPEGVKHLIPTAGINPFYQDTEEIFTLLKDHLQHQIDESITEIHFYGAGCANAEKCAVVGNALKMLFPEAEIEVSSDLVAAARAVCKHKAGIACILGTGSNSCYFNGEKIEQNVSPLGFILGDEGSGAVLGRKVVADYLKLQMPETLRAQFEIEFALNQNDVLNRVYRQSFPNRYLATFTRFLSANIETPYCTNLVESSFAEFIDRNLTHYPNYSQLPIHFVGSIAFHFKHELHNVIKSKGLCLGEIIQNPINGLADFHQ